MRQITIAPVLNGWIVQVGCQTVVYEDKNYMLSELGKYIDDPEATEKRYVKDAVNKDIQDELADTQVEEPRPKTATEASIGRGF